MQGIVLRSYKVFSLAKELLRIDIVGSTSNVAKTVSFAPRQTIGIVFYE
jgi:hypothetical protein